MELAKSKAMIAKLKGEMEDENSLRLEAEQLAQELGEVLAQGPSKSLRAQIDAAKLEAADANAQLKVKTNSPTRNTLFLNSSYHLRSQAIGLWGHFHFWCLPSLF